jgi:SagB-type dehydrogenase family enzyme
MRQRITGTIANLYHQRSKKKDAEITSSLLKDQNSWPPFWFEKHIKTYPGSPNIFFSNETNVDLDKTLLLSCLKKRKSSRSFCGSLEQDELGQVLFWSAGIITSDAKKGAHQRTYPSGGARYPLELYLWCKNVTGIKAGLYHYRPDLNILEQIYADMGSLTEHNKIFGYDWSKKASAIIFITASFERSFDKYGERSLRYVLIEAGQLGQNIQLLCTSLEIECCPFGAVNEVMIEHVLGIDGISESLVHTILLG